MVYHRRSWKVGWILFSEGRGKLWKLRELVAKNSEAQTGCPVTYTYTRREGRELLERHGLTVTDVRVEHIFPYRISDYVQYQYVKEWYFRWMPRPLFRALERRWGWHLPHGPSVTLLFPYLPRSKNICQPHFFRYSL